MPPTLQELMRSGYLRAKAMQDAPLRSKDADKKTKAQTISDLMSGTALATAFMPGVGDLAGMAADAAMYSAYPKERNLLNYGMTALGALPLVPAVSAMRSAGNAADAAKAATKPKFIDSLPGRNELNWWVDGGQDAVERGFKEEPFILLDKLYIDPQNRGQGAAKKVLKEGLEEMANLHPGKEVWLIAEPLDRYTNQSDLVRLYESVGFDVDGYQDGMSSIPMSLRLPAKKKGAP